MSSQRCAGAPASRGALVGLALALVAAAAFAVVTLSASARPEPAVAGASGVDVSGGGAAQRGAGPAERHPGRSFVTRSGSALVLDGAPFRFTGFNLYNAAASDAYSCPSAPRLDDAALGDAMRQVRAAGGTVVRFWAFQSYTRGGTDFRGVDRVLAAARAQGLKVLPVLENQWRDCSRRAAGPLSALQNGTWFSAGYRAPLPGQPLSFRDYARTITHHYRDDPTVLGWSLINEAEAEPVSGGGQSVLVGFARDVSAVVHQADPHHLVTLGTQSNGAPGASGADFTAVYGLPGMDFAEVHDWANRGSDDEAMPGSPAGSLLPDPSRCQDLAAPFACSFALARSLGKPIVVAEAGVSADDRRSRATRARQVAAKVDAAFRAGASGYLIWQLNQVDTDGYGVLVGSADPVFAVLRAARQRWALGD